MKILELLGASRRDRHSGPHGSSAGAFSQGAAEGNGDAQRRHRSLEEIGAKSAGWKAPSPPKPQKPKPVRPRKLKPVRAMKPTGGVLVEPPKPLKPDVPRP